MSHHAAHALLIAARTISRAEPRVRPHSDRLNTFVAEVDTIHGYFSGVGSSPTSALISLLAGLDAHAGPFGS